MKKSIKPSLLASAIALALASGPVSAVTYDLCAVKAFISLPDGIISDTDPGGGIPVWGYAEDTGAGCPAIPQIPGPALVVTDGTLTINLTNNLLVPTSIVIPGQALPVTTIGGSPVSGPTWNDNTAGSRGGDLSKRVRSYGAETPIGETARYTWTVERTGSFIYHSGTHPQNQVYMGLYGAVTQDAAAGEVYPGVAYDKAVTLFYSDIDPAFNNAVALGTLTTAIDRHPSWFLVNGEPYQAGMLPISKDDDGVTLAAGDNILVRFISAATEKHVPVFQGLYGEIHGEDGFQYNWQSGATVMGTSPRAQYSVGLPPLKTKDMIITPQADGTYAVYDGNGYMTNPSDPDNPDDGGDTVGGMLRFLELGLAADTPPVANDDAYSTKQDTPLAVVAPGVLDNDTDINGDALTASIVTLPSIGAVSLISDGSFTYTPNVGLFGIDSFTYVANDGTNDSLPATVTITVNEDVAPIAVDDTYTMDQDTVLAEAAPGVLANDTDANGDPLTAALSTGPSNGVVTLIADGSFTYTPTGGFIGIDSFTYLANDGANDSLPATVTITVNEVVTNTPPVAIDDAYSTDEDTTLLVPAPGVLDNDTDGEADPLTASIVALPTNGALTLDTVNADGSFSYTPNLGYSGADTFTYVANDGEFDSNIATVNITVNAVNDPPMANDDIASVQKGNGNSVTIDVAANDTDADGTLDLTSVIVESLPSGATVTNNLDGTVTLTLTSGNSVVRLFTYTIKDDLGAISNLGTVTVTVTK
jgi:FtsP/CotA-like multicopper oxidase with cupredoxin domain